jgi:ribosomal protein L18E
MSNELVPQNKADKLQQVLMMGNLSKLNNEEKVDYYNKVCETMSLNPLTKPFEFISFQGKEVMYATKNCAEQLRSRDKISIQIVSREIQEDLYVVVARAINADGRQDESVAAIPIATNRVDSRTGAVTVVPLSGMDRANAVMKCETKAKRRVTLSICGLGMLDETEVVDVPNAKVVQFEPLKALSEPKEESLLPEVTHASLMTKYVNLYKLDRQVEKEKLMVIYQHSLAQKNMEVAETFIKQQFEALFNENNT